MAFVEPHEAGKWPSAFWAAFWLVAFSLPLLISFADSGAPAPAPYTVVWIDSLPSAPAPKLERKPGKDLADIARFAEEEEEAARLAEEKKERERLAEEKRKAARLAEEEKERKRLAEAEKKADLLAEAKRQKIIEDREKRKEENRLRSEERKREKEKEEEKIKERERIELLAAEELRLREEEERAEKQAAAEAAEADAAAAADAAAEAERKRLADLLGVYSARIKTQIERKINRPAGLPFDPDIVVKIFIRVDADGFLIDDPRVSGSSGHLDFDEAAVRAVIQAQPLLVPKDEPKLLPQFREQNLIFSAGDF